MRWIKKWSKKHKFWAAVVVVFLSAWLLDSLLNTNISAKAGYLVGLAIVAKSLLWISNKLSSGKETHNDRI